MSINTVSKARSHVGRLIVGLGVSDGGKTSQLTLPAISGVTTANPGVVTITAHGLTIGKTYTIVITGVLGATQANGTWQATVIDANTFSIPVNVTGAYSSAGTAVVSLTLESLKGIYKTTPITITPTASLTTATVYSTTFTWTGVAVGDLILAIPPAALEAGLDYDAFISATNTVTVRIGNDSAGTVTTSARQWTFLWLRFV